MGHHGRGGVPCVTLSGTLSVTMGDHHVPLRVSMCQYESPRMTHDHMCMWMWWAPMCSHKVAPCVHHAPMRTHDSGQAHMVVEHMWFPCVAKVVGHTWLHMVTDCTCMSTTLATGVNHPGCMCGTHGQSCVAHGGHELIMIQEGHGHHCVHVQPMSSGRWPCAPKAGAKLKVRLMMWASHGPQMLFSSAINPHEPHCPTPL